MSSIRHVKECLRTVGESVDLRVAGVQQKTRCNRAKTGDKKNYFIRIFGAHLWTHSSRWSLSCAPPLCFQHVSILFLTIQRLVCTSADDSLQVCFAKFWVEMTTKYAFSNSCTLSILLHRLYSTMSNSGRQKSAIIGTKRVILKDEESKNKLVLQHVARRGPLYADTCLRSTLRRHIPRPHASPSHA